MNDIKNKVLPYDKAGDKTEEVRQMFDGISGHYDLLNDILSLGSGRIWRNRAAKVLLSGDFSPRKLLDVASGTGDLAIEFYDLLNSKCEITGIDLAENMLKIARKKARGRSINFVQADGENIPFDDNYFEAISCSYGIRNFNNPQKGLNEFYRVLKASGRLVIVELSEPEERIFRLLYESYFRYLLPFVGGLVSRDIKAYKYLPESVHVFPCGNDFIKMLNTAGFVNSYYTKLFGGIATLYYAEKQL